MTTVAAMTTAIASTAVTATAVTGTVTGRAMTREITDYDQNFQCLRFHTKSLNFHDILLMTQEHSQESSYTHKNIPEHELNTIVLLVEHSDVSSVSSAMDTFPRSGLLTRWKSQLRIDDLFDACDKSKLLVVCILLL